MKRSASLPSATQSAHQPLFARQFRPVAAAALLLLAGLAPARAQTLVALPGGASQASWLTAPSATVKEGIETNLFGVSTNLAGHPPIANVSTWFTTLSAGLSANLLAGASPGGFFTTATLAYAADYTAYRAVAREDNLRNTLTLAVKGKSGPWSLTIDNSLLYVDGSREDQFFNTYNNLGYGPTRERRRQVQDRNASVLRYDATQWFARLVDSAQTYNLLIDEHNPVGAYKGYANWVNRDNLNIGPDFGYKLTPDFALVAGWRIGEQTQARLNYSPVDNDNTYNRVLLGFEGKLLPWLDLTVSAGPDFRRYSDGSNSGIQGNRHTWLYTQNQLTATLSPHDSLTASNKVWHFVSSAGVSSIQETTDTVAYRHIFTQQFSASAGVAITGHRYDFPAVRNDWIRSYPLNLTYAFNPHFALSADYANTGGHSHLPVAVSPGQNFSESLVSLSLKASF